MTKLIETNINKKINTFMPNGYKAKSHLIKIKGESYIEIIIKSIDNRYIKEEIHIETWLGVVMECVLRMTLELMKHRVKKHGEYRGVLFSSEWSDELKELGKEVGYENVWKII